MKLKDGKLPYKNENNLPNSEETLRDKFARDAMAALIISSDFMEKVRFCKKPWEPGHMHIAEESYKYANAMMKAREVKDGVR